MESFSFKHTFSKVTKGISKGASIASNEAAKGINKIEKDKTFKKVEGGIHTTLKFSNQVQKFTKEQCAKLHAGGTFTKECSRFIDSQIPIQKEITNMQSGQQAASKVFDVNDKISASECHQLSKLGKLKGNALKVCNEMVSNANLAAADIAITVATGGAAAPELIATEATSEGAAEVIGETTAKEIVDENAEKQLAEKTPEEKLPEENPEEKEPKKKAINKKSPSALAKRAAKTTIEGIAADYAMEGITKALIKSHNNKNNNNDDKNINNDDKNNNEEDSNKPNYKKGIQLIVTIVMFLVGILLLLTKPLYSIMPFILSLLITINIIFKIL